MFKNAKNCLLKFVHKNTFYNQHMIKISFLNILQNIILIIWYDDIIEMQKKILHNITALCIGICATCVHRMFQYCMVQ